MIFAEQKTSVAGEGQQTFFLFPLLPSPMGEGVFLIPLALLKGEGISLIPLALFKGEGVGVRVNKSFFFHSFPYQMGEGANT